MEVSQESYRVMTFYDFKVGLTEDQCVERLHSAFHDEAPSRATVFRWFREFQSGRDSFSDEERTGRPRAAGTPENIVAVQKMVDADGRCTYRMMEESLKIGSAALYAILHKELHLKKVVSRWVPHTLTQRRR